VVKHRAENAVGPGSELARKFFQGHIYATVLCSGLLDCSSLAQIFVSPRQRARKTFELLFSREGKLPPYEITDEVREWDYGQYEGLVTSEIREMNPTWEIFLDGLVHCELPLIPFSSHENSCPEGESAEEMSARMDRVVSKV
jgi:sedoheptulose-bisphosphatase